MTHAEDLAAAEAFRAACLAADEKYPLTTAAEQARESMIVEGLENWIPAIQDRAATKAQEELVRDVLASTDRELDPETEEEIRTMALEDPAAAICTLMETGAPDAGGEDPDLAASIAEEEMKLADLENQIHELAQSR